MTKRKSYRQRLGKWGEDRAVHFLLKKGYTIIERNFRTKQGEIDIIAKEGKTVIFVEVKTKMRGGFGAPEEWVDHKKQIQIGKVASAYLQMAVNDDVACRFDVVAIDGYGNKFEVRHIVDAFWLEPEDGGRVF